MHLFASPTILLTPSKPALHACAPRTPYNAEKNVTPWRGLLSLAVILFFCCTPVWYKYYISQTGWTKKKIRILAKPSSRWKNPCGIEIWSTFARFELGGPKKQRLEKIEKIDFRMKIFETSFFQIVQLCWTSTGGAMHQTWSEVFSAKWYQNVR